LSRYYQALRPHWRLTWSIDTWADVQHSCAKSRVQCRSVPQVSFCQAHLQCGLEVNTSIQSDESLESSVAVISDHFRCPEQLLSFSLRKDLSAEASWFRLGRDVVCWGRLASSPTRCERSPEHDVLGQLKVEDGNVVLPFSPSEIIDNLRLERYVKNTVSLTALRRLYYLLRPFMGPSIRRRIQSFHARGWNRLSFPRWPVDTTVENICETLLLLCLRARHATRIPFVWFWPKRARGCVMMTHDVETEAGLNDCERLMDIDESFGIKSAFQLVPEGRYQYRPDLVDSMRKRGFEVGIQDLNHDGRLFDREPEFLRRASRINQYAARMNANGFRAGALYRRPEWYSHLEFSFDMSIPNVAHLDPQAGGCCTVRPYFIGKVLELPVTTTQDYTLFNILNEHSIDLWKSQIDRILAKNGLVSFIVHPDYLNSARRRAVYQELLEYLRALRSKGDLWFALPQEVDAWWRRRHEMQVEKKEQSWHITGNDAERFTLAFAVDADGKLEYEF
jgi:hypothetical protein